MTNRILQHLSVQLVPFSEIGKLKEFLYSIKIGQRLRQLSWSPELIVIL